MLVPHAHDETCVAFEWHTTSLSFCSSKKDMCDKDEYYHPAGSCLLVLQPAAIPAQQSVCLEPLAQPLTVFNGRTILQDKFAVFFGHGDSLSRSASRGGSVAGPITSTRPAENLGPVRIKDPKASYHRHGDSATPPRMHRVSPSGGSTRLR